MKNNELIGIYGLFNPISRAPFYIGAAIDPTKRLRSHIRGNKMMNIKELKENNCAPEMVILDECVSSEAMQLESFWIETFKGWGFPLENKVIYSNYNYGGKREGAGRPERPQGSSNHTLWIPDDLWKEIAPENTGFHSRNQFAIESLKLGVKKLIS